MALKVMLSSVRRGLADVRDAVAPVIKILRYDVIRFETVIKTPVPPRATCVAMVEDSDIYLLILGEEYGEPMPGTGLAPTEEEWTVARNLGMVLAGAWGWTAALVLRRAARFTSNRVSSDGAQTSGAMPGSAPGAESWGGAQPPRHCGSRLSTWGHPAARPA